MPPEIEENAEAADRVAVLIVYLILATVVLLLLRDSSIAVYAVGLTLDHWKSAVAMGGLLSFVPLCVVAFLRFAVPNELRGDPQSRGPLASWCGLAVLGSFSAELWRACCINALVHLGFSAWIAILIASIAYGASQLARNTGAVLGATFFGSVAGFLFVNTGSILAPFTMGLITAGAHLYRARHISSGVGIKQAHFSVICPFCSTSFDRRTVRGQTAISFTCPGCSEELAYDNEPNLFSYLWFALSVYGFPFIL